MAYGKIKADTLVYDNSGSDTEVTISSLGSKAPTADPTFTGNVTVNAQGDLRLADSDSTHYVGFQAPGVVTTSVVWTLPTADGTNGQLLKTNGSNVLSWVDDSALSLIDEDNMSSDSNTRPPSQQSVKAYVDAKSTLVVADESSDTTCFPVFVTAATGTLAAKTGSNITFNSSTGLLETSAVTTTGNVIVGGNLTVSGTTTTVNTATLEVEDKNIELGKVSSPSDTTADGGGITLKGATDKTFNWVDATDAWTSSEHIHLGDTKKIIFGAGSDFQIYHNGNHTYMIDTTGTGNVYLDTNKLHIRNAAGDENQIVASENGSIDLYYDNSKKFETTAGGGTITGNFTATGTVSDSEGNLRDIPQSTQGGSGAYTLVAGDAGQVTTRSQGTITVPNSVFASGKIITLINTSGSDMTITQGSGVTMYNSADASTGNRTLASRGMATLYFVSASACYISGAGLS